MKKTSRKPLEQPPQVAPLVRGPLDAKQKGEVGELAFLHKAASLGFGVAQPHGDSELYDFVIDSGERFWRVQVKSIYVFSSRYGYRTRSTHSGNTHYTAEEIDVLVAYIVPRNLWYVIPVDCVPASGSVSFYPSGHTRGIDRMEVFREAWHLMAPGADLSRPRILRQARTANLHHKRFVE